MLIDVVSMSLEHVLKITEAKEQVQIQSDGKNSGFTRRASEFPSLLVSLGLVPALTFYIVKADYETYIGSYRYLSSSERDSTYVEYVKSELRVEEGVGFSLYLACVAKVLERLTEKRLDELPRLAETLYDIASTVDEIRYLRTILSYSTILKDLARSLIG